MAEEVKTPETKPAKKGCDLKKLKARKLADINTHPNKAIAKGLAERVYQMK